MCSSDLTIIDVGINVNEEGKLCGDVNFADAEPVVDAITPVPGGVLSLKPECSRVAVEPFRGASLQTPDQ